VWSGQDDPTENAKKDEDQAILPPVSNGERARSLDVEAQTKTTKPPPHYTEGTLLKAMLNAGSKDQDAEVRDLLSNGGLGTQATRQEIIEKLKYRDFARIEGKKIISTQRARDFVDILRSESSRLVDVVATADLERRLREVEKDPSKMPEIWREYVRSLRDEIEVLRRTPVRRKLPASPKGPSGSGRRKSPGKASSTSKGAAKRSSAGSKRGARSSGSRKAGGRRRKA
jgi:DNA topoisomerase-3